MIQAVFFDWFNTLARYEPPREKLHSDLLREFGIEISPQKLMPGLLAADKYFFTEGGRSSLNQRDPQKEAESYVRYAGIMLSTVGIKADKDFLLKLIRRWPQVFTGSKFVLFEDTLPTLKSLKERGLILGLLTNAAKEAISVCRTTLGLEPYLDVVVTSEEAGADKPHPPIFLKALEKAGVKASEAMHVGDQYESDIVGARGVGIKPVCLDRYDLFPEITDCPRIRTLTEVTGYL
ncbi:MAG: HAD family hydrolase [Chloroflexota bacterium]